MTREFVIKAMYLADVEKEKFITDGFVRILDGKIVEFGKTSGRTFSDDIEITDFQNATILPGLIDCHTHLIYEGTGFEAPDYLQNQTDQILNEIGLDNLRRHINCGVTTLFDNGGKGDLTLKLRQVANEENKHLPDVWSSKVVLCSGLPKMRDRGGNIDPDDPENAAKVVERLIKEDRVDWIKLYATRGGLAPQLALKYGYGPTFPNETLKAIIQTAHSYGKKVGAHCVTTDGINAFVDCDGDCIIHAEFNDSPFSADKNQTVFQKVVDSGKFVNPTLYTAKSAILAKEAMADSMNRLKEEKDNIDRMRAIYSKTQQTIFNFWEKGVRLLAGSDSGFGYYPFGHFYNELIELHHAGIPIMEVIKMATLNPAKYMNRDDIGRLAVGARADLAVFQGNVTNNILALKQIKAVYKKGCRIV